VSWDCVLGMVLGGSDYVLGDSTRVGLGVGLEYPLGIGYRLPCGIWGHLGLLGHPQGPLGKGPGTLFGGPGTCI